MPRCRDSRRFHRIEDVPEAVDLAIVAVPAPSVVDTVQACAARGVQVVQSSTAPASRRWAPRGGACSSGCSEIATETGLRIVGPNCLGVYNSELGFFATFSTTLEDGFPGTRRRRARQPERGLRQPPVVAGPQAEHRHPLLGDDRQRGGRLGTRGARVAGEAGRRLGHHGPRRGHHRPGGAGASPRHGRAPDASRWCSRRSGSPRSARRRPNRTPLRSPARTRSTRRRSASSAPTAHATRTRCSTSPTRPASASFRRESSGRARLDLRRGRRADGGRGGRLRPRRGAARASRRRPG